MASHAMSLLSMEVAAAAKILLPRYSLQMPRVTAPSVAAEMIQVQSFWDHSSEQLVSKTVGKNVCIRRRIETAVAEIIHFGSPEPAAIRSAWIDLGPEALFVRRANKAKWAATKRIAPRSPTSVMKCAEVVLLHLAHAIFDRANGRFEGHLKPILSGDMPPAVSAARGSFRASILPQSVS